MIRQVIENNLCIGCGACAVVSPGGYRIRESPHGLLQAEVIVGDADGSKNASTVCPFSDSSKNEDELSSVFLKDAGVAHDLIGRHIRCYAGRVADDALYAKSSSGGIGRWLLARLLTTGEIDRVLHVVEHKPDASSPLLYKFAVATTEDEVFASGKSAYYPVEMSEVIAYALENPGRYAITGVPCFIKAVRNLMLVEPLLAERIKYTVGIVCGHLKGRYYAEMIGWQLGVAPQNLTGLDFRLKIPDKKANEKGCAAQSSRPDDPVSPPKTVKELFGTDYGHGYFKYKACDYCDDVLAETADISIGDAWLPRYMDSSTSVVVVRNGALLKVLEKAVQDRELELEVITADDVAKSQDAGLRHRRDGLAYRLHIDSTRSQWVPKKRIEPRRDHLSAKQRRIIEMRVLLAEKSFEHFEEAKRLGDLSHFIKAMTRLNKQYTAVYVGPLKSSLLYRAAAKVVRCIRSILK